MPKSLVGQLTFSKSHERHELGQADSWTSSSDITHTLIKFVARDCDRHNSLGRIIYVVIVLASFALCASRMATWHNAQQNQRE